MVYTRVTSVKSPWMAGCEAGDVHAVPVSHGEGRFFADEETVRRLAENGQIVTQYVTPEGAPSGDILWNPNGSVCAIEGITSPCLLYTSRQSRAPAAGERRDCAENRADCGTL